TVRANFPHTALQLMVLPRGGLNETNMGRLKAVEPLFAEEGIGPALMDLCHFPPRTPVSSAFNMGSVQMQRFAQSLTDGGFPAGVAANGTVTGS
ncbi:MAG TPA: hypothetical protein VMV69_05300, partial [Pirellulales bacterium]|nr:hypothetical protein [Pirellulales bacterium]